MQFNFNWNYISAGAPYVTVSSLGLAFNSVAISLLDTPEYVMLGFDEKAMAIGIRKATEAEIPQAYKFSSRIKNGWIRIGCKDFTRYLSEISSIDFKTAKKFIAKFDDANKILYITVDANQLSKETENDDN